MHTSRGRRFTSALAVLAASAFATAAWAANPASAITGTGQTLTVQIDTPTNGATVPAGPLTVTGKTSIGSFSANTAVEYVIDTSGSTSNPNGMDCNGDGSVDDADNFDGTGNVGSTLDCEVSGVLTLNRSLFGIGGLQVGLITFSDGDTEADAAKQRDLNPAVSGVQAFTAPDADADGNGVRDVEAATRPLSPDGGTNYDAALRAVNAAFAARPAGEQHVTFFLSDGVPTPGEFTIGAGSPLAVATAAGTKIYTYSVGNHGAGCTAGSPLLQIATSTGGSCTDVIDPSALTNVLAGTTPAGISGVEVYVDGANPALATLDALGNFTAGTSIAGAGPHTIQATVTATDLTTTTAEIGVIVGSPNADLSIVKTASQSSVQAGDNITYNLVVSNAGPANASGVVVTDNIPSGTTYVSAGASQGGCGYSAPVLTCNLGGIANGGMASVTVVVKTQTGGTIVNTASVNGNEPDPTPGNSSSSVAVTVQKKATTLTAQPAILSVLNGSLLNLTLRFEAKLTSGGSAVAGSTVTFTAGSQSCSAPTNAAGTATCSLTLSRLVATTLRFGYDASYAGSTVYAASSAHAPIVQLGGLKLF